MGASPAPSKSIYKGEPPHRDYYIYQECFIAVSDKRPSKEVTNSSSLNGGRREYLDRYSGIVDFFFQKCLRT